MQDLVNPGGSRLKSGLFPFMAASTLVMLIFLPQIRRLFAFAWNDKTFSYILVVPVVGVYLLVRERRVIFESGSRYWFPAVGLIVIGIAARVVVPGYAGVLPPQDILSIMTLSALCCIFGALGTLHGPGALKAAAFPFGFMALAAPIPDVLLDPIVEFLQAGSADTAHALLASSGVPVFREGYLFQLPNLTIEVAKQCSGIRSSLSLFLTSLIAGHLFLKGAGRKAIFSLAVIPITILKNGIRIATLTLLTVYVDPRILRSPLHEQGGIPFFVLALFLLILVLLLLKRTERDSGDTNSRGPLGD